MNGCYKINIFFKRIFFLFFIPLIFSCKKNDDINQIKISGKVIDKSSALPIYEALVSIKTSDGWFSTKSLKEVLTDSAGTYAISFSRSDVTEPSISFSEYEHKTETQVINESIPKQVMNIDLDSL